MVRDRRQEEDCIGSQGAQRTVALGEEEEKQDSVSKNDTLLFHLKTQR